MAKTSKRQGGISRRQRNRLDRLAKSGIGTRLDLDETQNFAVPSDQIELAAAVAQVAFDDSITLERQPGLGSGLANHTLGTPMGLLAKRVGRRPTHWKRRKKRLARSRRSPRK
jgi:hypothetical protein